MGYIRHIWSTWFVVGLCMGLIVAIGSYFISRGTISETPVDVAGAIAELFPWAFAMIVLAGFIVGIYWRYRA